jgi:hypothetical protein
VIFKCFILVYGLYLHYFFLEPNILNLLMFILSHFKIDFAFIVSLTELSKSQGHADFLLCFLSEILQFVFLSMLHFKLAFA